MSTDDGATPASGSSETQAAELANDFKWDGDGLEDGMAIAFSGGGFRAMLFHAGALVRLNEFGLLSQAKRISSVSGGSIAAGHLAAVWPALNMDATGVFANFVHVYVAPLLAFSRQNLDIRLTLEGLLPGISAADRLAGNYDHHLFGGRTLQDLPDDPRFVFCATNLQTGVLWRFSKPYAGDYIVGRLANPRIRLAQAVAASSAFPPFLSPLELKLPEGSFTQWPGETRQIVPEAELADYRAKVILTDGGVYDNHGIEPIVKRYRTVFVSDGGAPFGRSPKLGWDWIRQLRRVLDVTDNQVRALRRRDLIARFSAGKEAFASGPLGPSQLHERLGAYWGIDTDPLKAAPPDALPCSTSVTRGLARVSTRLADVGERTAMQLINWGYAICDRCIRKHYKGPVTPVPHLPAWPYPAAPL